MLSTAGQIIAAQIIAAQIIAAVPPALVAVGRAALGVVAPVGTRRGRDARRAPLVRSVSAERVAEPTAERTAKRTTARTAARTTARTAARTIARTAARADRDFGAAFVVVFVAVLATGSGAGTAFAAGATPAASVTAAPHPLAAFALILATIVVVGGVVTAIHDAVARLFADPRPGGSRGAASGLRRSAARRDRGRFTAGSDSVDAHRRVRRGRRARIRGRARPSSAFSPPEQDPSKRVTIRARG